MLRSPHSRPTLRQDERGMALAISLFAIVVIGALVAGTAIAGQMEMGGGRSAIAATQAVEQAEIGVVQAFENWDVAWNSLAVGDSSGYTTVYSPSLRDRYTVNVTRLGGVLFYVKSTGERLGPTGQILASRNLGQLASMTVPEVEVDAAVEGMGDVRVGGSSTVSGIDSNPAGWGSCTGALSDVPGVRASGDVQQNGGAQILGAPSPTDPYVANDTTVTPQGFTDVYDALIGAVTKTLPGGNYNGMAPDTTLVDPGSVCKRSDNNNWGEPGDPDFLPIITKCRSYMPVILFTGDTQINTGKGQGVLIIQGDLRIQGTFIFDGIILATGNIDFHGTGGTSSRIYGGLFSANSADVGDLISLTGAPVITYSSCAIAAVLAAAGTGVPLARRGWVQIVY
jgi:hypothetical protein